MWVFIYKEAVIKPSNELRYESFLANLPSILNRSLSFAILGAWKTSNPKGIKKVFFLENPVVVVFEFTIFLSKHLD